MAFSPSASSSSRQKPNLSVQIPAPVESHFLLPLIDFNWHFQSIVSPSSGGGGSGIESPAFSPAAAINPSDIDKEESLRDEFFRVFKAFDENDDGLVSKDEVRKLMAKLGHDMSDSDLDLLMLVVDLNGDGCVDFEEFHLLYMSNLKGMPLDGSSSDDDRSSSSSSSRALIGGDEEDNLMDAFRVFDKNNDGFITAEELHSVLSNLGFVQGARSIAACRNMIRGVDSNGDGLVDFSEFKSMMLARPSPRSYFASMIAVT